MSRPSRMNRRAPGTWGCRHRRSRPLRRASPARSARPVAARSRVHEGTRVIAIALLAVIAATRCRSCAWSRRAPSCRTGPSTTTPVTRAATTADFTQKSWPEYRAFMDTANTLAPGRMAWEGGDAIGAYGTPLAMMLLPYWTHGRIASMEGLYFEASATTPYHFMMIATLAQSPSNPVRGLPYRTIADFDLGVRYLQLMGVRYYAAFTDTAKAAAAKNPALIGRGDRARPRRQATERLDDLRSCRLGHRRGARLPAGRRRRLPRRHVLGSATTRRRRPPDKRRTPSSARGSARRCRGSTIPTALDRPLTDGGPASWTRASAATARAVPKQPVPEAHVSNIHTTESSIEFDVDRVGVPVMVKTSYFPNWQAEGRSTVPGGPPRTSWSWCPPAKHVKLTYGTTKAEWAGRFLTLGGLVGLGGLVWWGWASARKPDSRAESDPAPGTISVPLPAVRTRGSRARLCARLHLQGLRRSRDLSR